MKVKAIVPRGYCKGVVRAINMAKKQAQASAPVSILGMIVHNQYIVDALAAIGVKTIDQKGATREELLANIHEGTVIITAHGASEKVIAQAKQKGLEVVDATCPDVIQTHQLIKQYLTKDFEILYIGKNGHPESEGALSLDPQRIHLITTTHDIDHLDPTKKYVMTNQTTMSLYDVYNLCQYAKENLPNIEIAKETCNATKVRQEAIASLEKEIDVVFIVGDPHSNNTKKLAQIASEKANKTVYMIESVQDITNNMLHEKKYAAISAGASTPTYLTNLVIQYLEQYDASDPTTYPKPNIDVTKIL